MLLPKSRRGEPCLLFEEATEIGRVFKAQIVGDFLGLLIGEEEEPLGFEDKPLLDDLLGRLLVVSSEKVR